MNCKQGELAWINDPRFLEGHLRYVEVLMPYGVCESSIEPGHHWWVRAQGWVPIQVPAGGPDFIFPDSLLRPIRPDSEPEEITRELETS